VAPVKSAHSKLRAAGAAQAAPPRCAAGSGHTLAEPAGSGILGPQKPVDSGLVAEFGARPLACVFLLYFAREAN
jgi:hypothetical protein